MKKPLYITGVFSLIIAGGLFLWYNLYAPRQNIKDVSQEIKSSVSRPEIKDGDLIFQTSLSQQSKAIQLATHSKYSHCGLIYKKGADFFVFEAIQPVQWTPLEKWIARGEKSKFVIKRLKHAEEILTPTTVQKMIQTGETFKGKDYDLTFEWSDDKIYCSELIWKVYQRAAGIEIGKRQKLSEFDLANEIVKKKMAERYGSKIPMNETVISPSAIFNSDLLTTVTEN